MRSELSIRHVAIAESATQGAPYGYPMKASKKKGTKSSKGASKSRQRKSVLSSPKKIPKASQDALRQEPQTRSSLVPPGPQLNAGLTVENARTLSDAALEAVADSVSIQDRDFRIIYQNRASRNIFGDCVGQYCYRAYQKSDNICGQCALVESFRDGKAHTTERAVTNEKGLLHFEVRAAPLRDAAGAIIAGIEIGRNITNRKRAEQELLQEKKFSDNIINSLPGTFYILDDRGTFIRWNKKAEEATGCSAEELGRAHPLDFFEGEDKALVRDTIEKVFHEGGAEAEARVVSKTGEKTPYLFSARRATVGGKSYLVGMGFDITERKKTEEMMRRSRERLQLLIDRMPMGCIMWNAGFRVELWNPEAGRIFGYTAAEAIGKQAYDIIVPPGARPQVDVIWRRLLKGDATAGSENENMTRDGRTIICDWHNTPLRDEEGKVVGVLSMVQDVTERKRTEDEKQKLQSQLLQAQKMEAVGQLAGGIAHDFNNILTAIIGYGSIALAQVKEDDPLRSYVDHMLTAANRAASLTQSLLAFSRKQIINPQPVAVNAVIERVQKLLHRIIGEDIELTTALTEDDTTVLADAGQLEQVLINLATNARDAMPDGGHLTVTTVRTTMGDDYIRSHGYGKEGTYMLISVTDTGDGMDDKTRERVFEPFFTTKEVGKGTGLGLAIVYGIVKQHNGYINVYSEPRRGTTFKIYLPAFKTDAKPMQPAGPPAPPKRGTETVLLAEDDTTLRNLARAVLEGHGYTVIEAEDGQEAIDKLRLFRDRIQLLLVDVVMPKKNGKEVYEEAQRITPGLKALFASGYPADIIQKKGILEEGIKFVSKPIAPVDLLRKVREVLDE
jgi:PAS domain S-box-containing protein